MTDRKRMKKVREKRIEAITGQIEKHMEKIRAGKGQKDTTNEYWKKEIERSFKKQKKKDEKYLEENQ